MLNRGGGGTVFKPKSSSLNEILIHFLFPQNLALHHFFFSARKQLNCLPVKYETYMSYLELTLCQHIKDICTLFNLPNSAQKIYKKSSGGLWREKGPSSSNFSHTP